jgi:ABC-type glycerol-3-phosphate transport system substrate-binding protein
MKRFALTALAAAAALPLLAACGGDSGSDSDTTLPPSDVQVIAIDGIAWNSDNYSASAGTVTILGRNESSLPHNLHLVAADGSQLPEFIDLPGRGDADVIDVDLEAGEYTIVCLIPGHANMTATLTIN